MTPDKIYLDEDMIRYHVLDKKLNESDIEYIRKSALLEWLEEELRNTVKDYLMKEIQPMVNDTLQLVANAIQDAYMKGFESGLGIQINLKEGQK